VAEVKWIKLNIDMFDNRKIKHIRKLPEGDRIVLIWVMLLTMAGRCNASGMIFITENIPYTDKMLADELGYDENTITESLNTLEYFGMVSRDSVNILIPGWEDHQNVAGLDQIREQNRLRKQRQRERNRNGLEKSEDCDCHTVSRDSHVTVTQQNKNKKEDIEKDINILCAEESARESSNIQNHESDFEEIYSIYPKKRGKSKAFEYYLGFVGKKGRLLNKRRYHLTPKQIYIAVANYVAEQEQKGTEVEFYKNFDTFLNKPVLDYLEDNEE